MSPSDQSRLQRMREAIEKILVFMQDKTMSDLIQYFEVADVVERELEILGEASNKISARFKNENPEFAWREMKDLRNRVIHDYDAIDPQTIYRVVTHALPGLKERLEKLELPAIQKPVLMPKNIQSLCYCRRRG